MKNEFTFDGMSRAAAGGALPLARAVRFRAMLRARLAWTGRPLQANRLVGIKFAHRDTSAMVTLTQVLRPAGAAGCSKFTVTHTRGKP